MESLPPQYGEQRAIKNFWFFSEERLLAISVVIE
jgi:hypothetical protein